MGMRRFTRLTNGVFKEGCESRVGSRIALRASQFFAVVKRVGQLSLKRSKDSSVQPRHNRLHSIGKIFLNARSSVGCLSRFFPTHDSADSGSEVCGNWPLNACGTRLTFAPHDRQKLAPSRFCVAHFGQNIYFSPFFISKANILCRRAS